MMGVRHSGRPEKERGVSFSRTFYPGFQLWIKPVIGPRMDYRAGLPDRGPGSLKRLLTFVLGESRRDRKPKRHAKRRTTTAKRRNNGHEETRNDYSEMQNAHPGGQRSCRQAASPCIIFLHSEGMGLLVMNGLLQALCV